MPRGKLEGHAQAVWPGRLVARAGGGHRLGPPCCHTDAGCSERSGSADGGKMLVATALHNPWAPPGTVGGQAPS